MIMALKTYMLRQLAVVTANHVHHHLHGRLRGHVSLRPAAERAEDPEQHAPVADCDVTEHTVDADDAMVIEERQRTAAAATDPAARRRRAREAGLARGATASETAGGDAREGVAQEGGGSGLGCELVTTLYMSRHEQYLGFRMRAPLHRGRF